MKVYFLLINSRSFPKLGNTGLNWRRRIKIIKGVARGLSYLHKELPNSSVPHGHLKSSNVLLDQDFTPILSDYALFPLLQESHAYHHMSAFKSPDFAAHHDRTSKSTDVWSLGILILETLTGKSPANYLHQGNGTNADIAAWVDTVVREEWTAEVFDNDIVGRGRGEEEEDGRWECNGEMLKLLKIGMCCCERDIGKRWGLKQAVEKIELNLNEDEDDDEYYSSYGSFYSNSSNFKAAVPEDEFSFFELDIARKAKTITDSYACKT